MSEICAVSSGSVYPAEQIKSEIGSPPPENQNGNLTSSTSAACSKAGIPGEGIQLLHALWRSTNLFQQIGTLDRQTGTFRNIPVGGVVDAVRHALALSGAGAEAYFACAEYRTPDCRVAANAFGAFAFWMDIDCGEEKAAAGKGYPTVIDAQKAVRQFCKDIGLPEPTHIVPSGGGLHVYWVLDSLVDRATWQAYAARLKRLTHAHGLLADDSRTADISSVLRMPGTLNHKYDPPRPVSLQYASVKFIEQAVMLDTIDSAHSRLCHVAATQLPRSLANADSSTTIGKDLVWLHALLDHIDPDIEYDDWLRVLMAIHHETGGSGEGLALADRWSSTGSKYLDSHEIREKWNSFKPDFEKPITIGTIIRMVNDNGGDWMAICSAAEDAFECLDDEAEGDE